MTSTFTRYQHATTALDALIEHATAPDSKSLSAVRERAEFRMGRLRRFLTHLGNPHLRYPIVHVGGTSGKGSTSTAIAAILTAAGYRTGLHTSPYLQAASEKLQLDGQLIDPVFFAELTEHILSVHTKWIERGESPLTYGEIWMALTVSFFAEAAVDIAVLEVGAGGRFDLTNVVTPAVSVITSVGIDHTSTLGNTIEEIAWHKAGIIKPGVPVVMAVTNAAASSIIHEEAILTRSSVVQVPEELDVISTGPEGTVWREQEGDTPRTISLGGHFQARNGSTAVAAVQTLERGGMRIAAGAYDRGLRSARIPGRMEIVNDRVPILLDGAHNAEKVAALAADVNAFLPLANGRRIAVLGVLEAKQADEMIRSLMNVVDAIVATAPQVLAKESKDAAKIADIARQAGFEGPVHIESDPWQAITFALAQADDDDAILVSGSLYLVGNVRGRWFDEREIVLQRTSWPVSSAIARAHRLD